MPGGACEHNSGHWRIDKRESRDINCADIEGTRKPTIPENSEKWMSYRPHCSPVETYFEQGIRRDYAAGNVNHDDAMLQSVKVKQATEDHRQSPAPKYFHQDWLITALFRRRPHLDKNYGERRKKAKRWAQRRLT